jgi:shikimate kinase
MGYYDPYPLIALERPICLIGFMGCDVHSIGYFISSLTGISFVEVDKLLEHDVGMSLAHFYLEHGESAWRALESKHLKRGLEMRPARLLCLGDGALLDPNNRSLCLDESDLIYIRRPHRSLLERVQKGRRTSPQRFPLWIDREPHSFQELRGLLEVREPTYEVANKLIDIGEMSALEAAQRIIKRLNLNVRA